MQRTTSPAHAHTPVRHGKCGLVIRINGKAYHLKKEKHGSIGTTWRLYRPRNGAEELVIYRVYRTSGRLGCTCPDQSIRGAHCKHIRALQACGLVGKSLKPAPAFSSVVTPAGSEVRNV